MALRLLGAHHPTCHLFAGDVYHLGGVPICRGCAATLPAFVLTLLPAVLLVPETHAVAVLLAATALAIPQLSTYVIRWPGAARIAAKTIGGVGAGLVVAAYWLWDATLGPKAVVGVGLVAAGSLGQGLRLRTIVRTCRACPWNMDWEHCPGFRPDVPFDFTPIDP